MNGTVYEEGQVPGNNRNNNNNNTLAEISDEESKHRYKRKRNEGVSHL